MLDPRPWSNPHSADPEGLVGLNFLEEVEVAAGSLALFLTLSLSACRAGLLPVRTAMLTKPPSNISTGQGKARKHGRVCHSSESRRVLRIWCKHLPYLGQDEAASLRWQLHKWVMMSALMGLDAETCSASNAYYDLLFYLLTLRF